MDNIEIQEILSKGEKCLNVEFGKEIKQSVNMYSNGLAAVCHQLCLNVCIAEGVHDTMFPVHAIEYDSFHDALKMYLEGESDTIKSSFDKALKRKRKRKYDNCRIILTALAALKEDAVTVGELLEKVRKVEAGYPPSNMSRYLDELQTEERGAILRFDGPSGKYSFSNPFYKVYMKLLSETSSDNVDLRSETYSSEFTALLEAAFERLQKDSLSK